MMLVKTLKNMGGKILGYNNVEQLRTEGSTSGESDEKVGGSLDVLSAREREKDAREKEYTASVVCDGGGRNCCAFTAANREEERWLLLPEGRCHGDELVGLGWFRCVRRRREELLHFCSGEQRGGAAVAVTRRELIFRDLREKK